VGTRTRDELLRGHVGGIVGLADILDRRWDAVESDFRRYYLADLRAAVFGAGDPVATGVRRIRAMIVALPADAAVRVEERADDPVAQWTIERELAASTFDAIGLLTWVFTMANSKEGADIGDPFRYPRPWDDDARALAPARRMSTPSEIAAFGRGAGGSVRYAPGNSKG